MRKRLTLKQAERYVMNELYKLERIALEGYGTYNFPRGMLYIHLPHRANAVPKLWLL